MSGWRSIQLLLLLLPFLFFVGSQSWSPAELSNATYLRHICNGNGTASNKFSYNLARLFNTQLHDEGGHSLYKASAYGEYPDKVYGLYLCRFDVPYKYCQNCIAKAVNTTTQNCNRTMEAFIWYDECLVGLSNRSFASLLVTSPKICMRNVVNVTSPEKFSELLNQTFNETIAMATSNDYKYATKIVNISIFSNLYSLVQCIPALSAQDCGACLAEAFAALPSCSGGQEGGRIISPSCNIRYELYPFYGEPIVPIPPPNNTSGISPPNNTSGISPPNNAAGSGEGGKGRKVAWIAIGTTLSAVIIVVLLSFFLRHMWRRSKRDKEEKVNSQKGRLLTL